MFFKQLLKPLIHTPRPLNPPANNQTTVLIKLQFLINSQFQAFIPIIYDQATISINPARFLLQINQTFSLMNIDHKPLPASEPAMCTSCKSFFGSQAFKGLCSGCHKKSLLTQKPPVNDSLRKESVDTQASFVSKSQKMVQEKEQQPLKKEQPPKQVDRKRCYCCKKKVGMLGIECKCGFVYCNSHRLPEQHSCSFNHQKVANDRLKETLVKVYNGKIEGI